MIVRDRTFPVTEYKGRPTYALDAECPCRDCYNSHDCGHGGYDGNGNHVWKVHMECASRYNNGCPNPLPTPQHVYSGPRGRVCKRCGVRR